MTDSATSISLLLKNDADELLRLSQEVDAFIDRNALSDDTRFGLQLCLEEALMNVINFGFDDLDEHDILIEISLQDDPHSDCRTLKLSLVDDGMELGYLEERDLELDSFLQDQAFGGLGFHLMRQYSDDLAYERKDGRNHLLLTKNITVPGGE